MGRKKKMVEPVVSFASEVKASNGDLDTKSDVEILHPHTESSKATEAMDVENQVHDPSSKKPEEKRSGAASCVVRRSPRIRTLSSPPEALKVVESVNLVEDEKEQEPEVHHDSVPPEANVRTLEEKIDYIVAAADYFKSKFFRAEDEVPFTEISYKSLYLDAQKKIEALMEENYDLVRKLEFARGKIAAYELMKDAHKEFVLVSTLEKAANVTASLSSPQDDNAPNGAADNPKPKRIYKKRAKY